MSKESIQIKMTLQVGEQHVHCSHEERRRVVSMIMLGQL